MIIAISDHYYIDDVKLHALVCTYIKTRLKNVKKAAFVGYLSKI